MSSATKLLPNDEWLLWLPYLEKHRPKGRRPPLNLRETFSAILWRHRNGAAWRAIPAELGGWETAFNLFDRWKRLGVWERLLADVAGEGASLGMVHLDGTNIRAHQKAGGAQKRGSPVRSGTSARRSDGPGAALAQRSAPSATVRVV